MALEKIGRQVTGSLDWIDLTSTIIRLYKAGVLREEGIFAPELIAAPSGFDASPIHAAMLNDRARTASYLAGIAEVVRPGDVVVDIGTGTGILAMAAARAGAERVYAIETSSIGKLAQANFEANGLTDRITLVQGWSTRVSLPERADVLISEIIGNEPLAEKVIEVTKDARSRMLKVNSRIVPKAVKIFGLALDIPHNKLGASVFVNETLLNWRSWYGFNFDAMADAANSAYQVFTIKPQRARDWNVLSDPILLAKIDFQQFKETLIDTTTMSTATASGELTGVLVYFELELSPSVQLSTHPGRADEGNCWYSLVWVLPKPLDLSEGDRFSVSYKYRKGVERSGITVTGPYTPA
ncbi:MAG: 50S ribosomal protein L11 methyltransferase [Pyrinomonadaceae bacterium]